MRGKVEGAERELELLCKMRKDIFLNNKLKNYVSAYVSV